MPADLDDTARDLALLVTGYIDVVDVQDVPDAGFDSQRLELGLHSGNRPVVGLIPTSELVQLGGLVLQRLHEDEAEPHRRQGQPPHWTTHGLRLLVARRAYTGITGAAHWRSLFRSEACE